MSSLIRLPSSAGEERDACPAIRLEAPIETDRPPVLYLHGFGSSQSGEKAEYFRRRFLSAGFPFCSLDFQGHGQSGGGMFDLTLTRNLEDVARAHELLRSRGHRKLILVGSSMGGLTGLWYAARWPQHVIAAIHMAPALGLDSTFADWLGEEGMRQWHREGVLRVTNELGSWDLGWSFVEDFRLFREDALVQLYRTPTLLLQGMKDDRVPWRSVVRLVAECSFKDLELHLFAAGDHRLVEQREIIWHQMAAFVAARGINVEN